MRKLLLIALIFSGDLMVNGSTVSQDGGCTKEQVKNYLSISGIDKQIAQVEQQFRKSNEAQKQKYIEMSHGSEEVQSAIHQYFNDLEKLNVNRTIIIENLIQETFSFNEMEKIINFYQSDIGKKAISFNSEFYIKLTEESQKLRDYVLSEGPKLQQKIAHVAYLDGADHL